MPTEMVPRTLKDTERMGTRSRLLGMFVLALLAGTGCRVTDHTEKDPDALTPELINIPASGFQVADSAMLPRFAFDSTRVDMGSISQGTRFEHAFRFRNVGGSQLVITDVRGSCGCTVSKDWPKQPIKPGEEGSIPVTFNSEGRSGHQDKTVTVTANTRPPTTVLYLTGEVLAPGTDK